MKEIKIGLIGSGWMGKAHTNAFLNAQMLFGPEFGRPVFECVSDTQEDVVKAAAEKLGFNRWTTNWMDIINDPAIDLVDIATPNFLHYEMAKAALLAGKHVYCEKPLCFTPAESKELADLAKEKGVVNYVGTQNVNNPANAYVRDLVKEGKLGKIMRFIATYDQDALLDPESPITWRHINKFAGSGALGDLASHMIAVSQMILGDIDSVNAVSQIIIPERPKARGSSEMAKVENDDIMTFMAKYKNGCLGTIGTSRVATGRKNFFSYEIQGTEGSVYYSLERMGEVQVYFRSDDGRDGGFRTVLLNPEHEGYGVFEPQAGIAIAFTDMKILEVHKLLAAITQGAPYMCDFAFGHKIDCVIDAVLQSAESEQWTKVAD
ncbi:Gfo/Idh/MocA family protein [Intestinibacillus massiliensis]|uniref:Gfo/Idh/MocA family protein n=1 Tax=Intestinibacillus massiliensis TaxID=1871029 RepID=UPI000B35ED2E|nr:Gfo/Idh/MocA family oxidoreductase [Intestinibacillus massiliensis]